MFQPAEIVADVSLELLLERRETLVAEKDRLARVENAAGEAEQKLSEIDQGIRAVETTERQSFERWADAGALGDPPSLKTEDRAQLERRRALGASDLRGAVAARMAVQGRLNEITAELNHVAVAILRHKAADAINAMHGKAARVGELAEQLKAEWIAVIGLRQVAVEKRADAAQSGRRDLVDIFAGIVAAIDAAQSPELEWTRGGIDAAAARWREALQ